MDEQIKRYLDHKGITKFDVLYDNDKGVALWGPKGLIKFEKDPEHGYLLHPFMTPVSEKLKKYDRVQNNHNNIFNSLNRSDMTEDELHSAYANAVDKWGKGFPEAAQLKDIPEKSRVKYWGTPVVFKRNYEKWKSAKPKKVFNMSENKMNNYKNDPYFKNYKFEDVPLENFANNNLNYHSEVWGEDPTKWHYDSNKDDDNDYIYASKDKNGKYKLANGRHRARALYNDGYTHMNIPVLDEKEDMERLGLIDGK